MTYTGHNTPNADAPLRIFLHFVNLRDSAAEDNVRKRPFYQYVMTRSPLRAIRVGANIRNNIESSIVLSSLFCKSRVFFFISAPKAKDF